MQFVHRSLSMLRRRLEDGRPQVTRTGNVACSRPPINSNITAARMRRPPPPE